jgi:hypothetical protein
LKLSDTLRAEKTKDHVLNKDFSPEKLKIEQLQENMSEITQRIAVSIQIIIFAESARISQRSLETVFSLAE